MTEPKKPPGYAYKALQPVLPDWAHELRTRKTPRKKPGPPKLYPVRIHLNIDEKLLTAFDKKRGNTNRNEAIRRAMKRWKG